MRPSLHCALLLTLPFLSRAQSPPPPAATLSSTTTLVLVPTLVRSPAGDLLHTLSARDFRLTDNGVEQQLTLETTERQPLSVVVLMQTGGAAPRQFANYAHLTPMLEAMMGSSAYRVALVTFDSRPEEIWNFPSRVNGLTDAFTKPVPGDDGAAILDAIDYGITLLADQPPTSRRILLLLSQPQDAGSTAKPEEVVRRLGETNTTIYSVTFSPEKQWLKDQFTHERHEQRPYQLGPAGPTLLHTFDLGTPLKVALKAMQQDTAATVASLSGGEHMRFGNRAELEQEFNTLANHIPNSYTLSFRPTSQQPGLHTLKVEVLHQPSPLEVSARTSYWSTIPTH